MTKQSHTPTPWRIALPDGDIDYQIVSEDTMDCVAAGLTEANAELIASAVNNHEALIQALEAVVRVADRATVEFDMARAALANAKG